MNYFNDQIKNMEPAVITVLTNIEIKHIGKYTYIIILI